MSAANSLAASERRKYKKCWSYSQYRAHSPGEWAIPVFKQIRRKKGSLVDLGCGTGRAGKALSEDGWAVTLLDFADNCLDYDVETSGLPFVKATLWSRWVGEWDVGYCCDVMEHMPPSKVDAVLKNVFSHCESAFFNIHFGKDNFRRIVGHPLHLTVKPWGWWLKKLSEYGEIVNARDLIGMGAFYVKG